MIRVRERDGKHRLAGSAELVDWEGLTKTWHRSGSHIAPSGDERSRALTETWRMSGLMGVKQVRC